MAAKLQFLAVAAVACLALAANVSPSTSDPEAAIGWGSSYMPGPLNSEFVLNFPENNQDPQLQDGNEIYGIPNRSEEQDN